MLRINRPDKKTDIDFFIAARARFNKSIYIAIAVIVILAGIAMTGVYYEYW